MPVASKRSRETSTTRRSPKNREIKTFDGYYHFLSNFHYSIVTYDDVKYTTVEHAYQAAKTEDPIRRETIRCAYSPGRAKRLGNDRELTKVRDDWENIKLRVMLKLVRRKFENPELRKRLLLTGNAVLIEGNYWKDTFWGVCNGVGQNHLGKILMRVRKEIRNQ